MSDKKAASKVQTKACGPVEPKAIILIGGPLNGKKVADLGQTQRQTSDGDLYKRVRMDAGDGLGQLCFDVLAYFGKTWEQSLA